MFDVSMCMKDNNFESLHKEQPEEDISKQPHVKVHVSLWMKDTDFESPHNLVTSYAPLFTNATF